MLMQSNRAAPGLSQRGEYEVVFAGEPLDLGDRASLISGPASEPLGVKTFTPKYLRSSGPNLPAVVRPRPAMTDIGFGPINLVRGTPVPVALPRPPRAATGVQIRTHRRSLRAACNPGLSRFESPSYSIALVGPTGSGKTTTAMKLCVQYGLLASRPCRLIAYDPDRVGTTERLRHFSTLLKIPFEAVETPARLAASINTRTEGLTIIDTPGCARADDQVLAGLAFLLGSHAEVETQVVLRADRKTADNIAAAARLSALSPKRLIVTGLDETSDYQELEALAIATALPLSFLGTGQRIPDDLEPACIQRLEDLVNYGWSKTVAAAA